MNYENCLQKVGTDCVTNVQTILNNRKLGEPEAKSLTTYNLFAPVH